MNKIKYLIVALIATLAFTSCSEDEPAKMLWEVTATPAESENSNKKCNGVFDASATIFSPA